jgi:hypothetical protein
MSTKYRQYFGEFDREARRARLPYHPAARGLGALLSIAISVIHVIDQGGLPGSREPAYVGILYYLLEVAGVVTALLLVVGVVRIGWLLSLGVSAGPLVCYLLSRGPGLPGYHDDIGNWAEPLGVISLVVEAALLALAIAVVTSVVRTGRIRTPAG